MSTPSNLIIDFLKKDNQELSQNGKDGSVGITAPKTIEQVTIVQNSDGSWSQSSEEKETKVKKDIEARADELAKYEGEVSAFVQLSKKTDDIILSVQTQINSKKQQIIDIIADAVSAGCSCVVGTAVTNGVVIGIGSTVVNDQGFIKKYTGLDDPTAQIPFQSDDTVAMTTSNVGTGYASEFVINSGAVVGIYKTVYPFTGFGTASASCSDYASSIGTLATEIGQLRSQIDNTLITNTNSIKDRKTTSELFVWGYKSREHKIQNQINENNEVIETIQNNSAYQ